MLGHDADIEVDQSGAGNVDANSDHGEPQEQILRRDPRHLVDPAVSKRARDAHVVVELALELGVARVVEVGLELARTFQAEILDPFREQTRREPVELQRFVD